MLLYWKLILEGMLFELKPLQFPHIPHNTHPHIITPPSSPSTSSPWTLSPCWVATSATGWTTSKEPSTWTTSSATSIVCHCGSTRPQSPSTMPSPGSITHSHHHCPRTPQWRLGMCVMYPHSLRQPHAYAHTYAHTHTHTHTYTHTHTCTRTHTCTHTHTHTHTQMALRVWKCVMVEKVRDSLLKAMLAEVRRWDRTTQVSIFLLTPSKLSTHSL